MRFQTRRRIRKGLGTKPIELIAMNHRHPSAEATSKGREELPIGNIGPVQDDSIGRKLV